MDIEKTSNDVTDNFHHAGSSSSSAFYVVADLILTTISSPDFIGAVFLFPALFFAFSYIIERLSGIGNDASIELTPKFYSTPDTRSASNAPTSSSTYTAPSPSLSPSRPRPLRVIALECRNFLACRCVSSLQAIFACVCAISVLRGCANDVIYATHWATKFYCRVAAPYFLYDIWAMYRAYCEERTLASSSDGRNTASSLTMGGEQRTSSIRNHLNMSSALSNDNGKPPSLSDEDVLESHSSGVDKHPLNQRMSLNSVNSSRAASSSSSPAAASSSNTSFSTFVHSNYLIIAHHLFVPFVLFPGVLGPWRRDRGDFIIACLFSLEASTPFVSLRAVLHRLGLVSSRLYFINGLLMLFVFGCCRILIFPFIYWIYSRSPVTGIAMPLWRVPFEIPAHCNLWCLLLFSLQLHWFVKMMKGALKMLLKKIMKKKEAKEEEEKKSAKEPLRYGCGDKVDTTNDLNAAESLNNNNNNNNINQNNNNNKNCNGGSGGNDKRDSLISEGMNQSITQTRDLILSATLLSSNPKKSPNLPFVDSASPQTTRPKTE